MKKSLHKFLIAPLVLLACNNDYRDPREAFIGTFNVRNFNCTLGYGTEENVFSVNTNPDIEFSWDEELDYDELGVRLEEFIDETVQQTLGEIVTSDATVTTEFIDREIANISGSEFEINEVDFIITIANNEVSDTFYSEFSGSGMLGDDEFTMGFEIVTYTGSQNFIFTGTAIGRRN